MIVNNKKEIRIIRLSLIISSALFFGLYINLFRKGEMAASAHDWQGLTAVVLFAVAMLFIVYGNTLYQVCLIGNYKRLQKHRPVSREALEAVYDGNAPRLTVLIPSYKEEHRIIWQTMVSSALAEYPTKNVVLLIDDPFPARALEDMIKVEKTRTLVTDLQALFDEQRQRFEQERLAYAVRRAEGKAFSGIELSRLAILYEEIAAWLEKMAANFAGETPVIKLPHGERFFINQVVLAPARKHHALAAEMREKMARDERVSDTYLARHYSRLVGLFSINFSSFERKKYVNISHEANKAMNLNCYINLMGKSWKEVETDAGLELHQCDNGEADFSISDADYVDTIDADSMMLGEYALRLIHLMEMPGNHRLAVVQSPCSSYPDCPDLLERVAGACIDVQFRTHQGYSYWDATFWVGANAMLRKTALEEIKETHIIDGKVVTIYIQDRTVIEDTESTIDLVDKGWKLYNYPERMTFSSTPPDFGSLLIQRRRWSNGGLIILPKLLSYTSRAVKNTRLLKEFFMRFHYLASTTTGVVVALTLMLYPFGDLVQDPLLPLAIIPLLMLYARDLKNTGYKGSDVWRVCAFNLMIFPVAIGGVCKQFQQMITGKKIPFGRTPKVTGRTAAPALYCLIELLLLVGFIASSIRNAEEGKWLPTFFSALNSCFMLYVLVYYIGVKALVEDVLAAPMARWRAMFHHAEIIPMPLRWIPATIGAKRKRA